MCNKIKGAALIICTVFAGVFGCILLNAFGTAVMDRQVFCRERLLSPEHTEQECKYPMQKIVLEQGVSRKLLVCRCP